MLCAVTIVLLFAFASCGGSGGAAGGNDPYAKFISHYDNMIKIVRDNKGNPDKMQKELTAYQSKNEAEMDKLTKDMEKFAKDNPMKALEYATQIMSKTEELSKLAEEMTGEGAGGK
jgi:hypothetical protein